MTTEKVKPNPVIKVHLVDDQSLIRQGMASLLAFSNQVQVTGQAEDGQVFVEQLEAGLVDADVILLDVRMPRKNGVEVLQYLQQLKSTLKCMILTTFDDHEAVLAGMKAGARAYLLKDVSLEELVAAIEKVHQGEQVLSPKMTEYLIEAVNGERPNQAIDQLTEKEQRVLGLMAEGLANKEIALALSNAEGTVRNQVSQILAKLQVRDRTQAILKAIEHGLLRR